LATYLVLDCEGLATEQEQSELLTLASKPATPKNIRLDIEAVSKNWN